MPWSEDSSRKRVSPVLPAGTVCPPREAQSPSPLARVQHPATSICHQHSPGAGGAGEGVGEGRANEREGEEMEAVLNRVHVDMFWYLSFKYHYQGTQPSPKLSGQTHSSAGRGKEWTKAVNPLGGRCPGSCGGPRRLCPKGGLQGSFVFFHLLENSSEQISSDQ